MQYCTALASLVPPAGWISLSHAKNSSKTGLLCFCRFTYRSSGVSIRLPSPWLSKIRSGEKILLQKSKPLAAADPSTNSLSKGNASTNIRLACAQQPQRMASVSLLFAK